MKKLFESIRNALRLGEWQGIAALISLVSLVLTIISLPLFSFLWNHQTGVIAVAATSTIQSSTLVTTPVSTTATATTPPLPTATATTPPLPTATATTPPLPTATAIVTSTSQSQNRSTPLQTIKSFCNDLYYKDYNNAYGLLSSSLQASYKSETNFATYYSYASCSADIQDLSSGSNGYVTVDSLFNNNQQLCDYHLIKDSQYNWYINSKWRECSTVFKVNGRKSARNIGIDYPKPKKAAPQAEAWAPFL